jgi:hypothetical protein
MQQYNQYAPAPAQAQPLSAQEALKKSVSAADPVYIVL